MKEFIKNHKKASIITAIILGIIIIAIIIVAIYRGVSGHWPWSKVSDNERSNIASNSYDDIRNFKGLVVTFEKVNGWQSNGYYAQFNVSVENHNNPEVTSWKFSIPTESKVEKDNAWNCNLDINDKLSISNVDYNGTIGNNQTISDVGMILKAASDSDLDVLSGTYIIDNTTGLGRLLTKEELKALREGPANPNSNTTAMQKVEPVTPNQPETGTPLSNHGALKVNGVDLVDSSGNKYQLKGVSTHGIQWFPEYVNEGSFKCLRDNWGANVVRLAMYTDEGGYCAGGDKAKLESVIDKGVNAATNLGMYVIIDWHILHDNNPMQHQQEAIDFFSRMSAKYANNSNVLYEICNEPNGGTSWNTIKEYADSVIPVIRANSKDAIVLVGTPTWSQDVDLVAYNPLNFENVMYTLHFYAGTHKDNIRSKLTKAREAGTPVFISEFSICDASGNGGIDYNSADTWKNLIKETNVSFVGWSLCNKNETSALLKPSCSSVDSFNDEDLSDTGAYLKAFILESSRKGN